MKIEVEIISKEMIKPSSPTPQHLRRYQLSFLDQISPPVYNPCIIFYSFQTHSELINTTNEISHKLKKSLSDVLTKFYPLAGRLTENPFVDCNDEGIPFFEARVKCQLHDVIQNNVPSDLNNFIPFALDYLSNLVLGVQLSIFECGGVAIGTCVSHRIADALSSFMFIKNWSATARGDESVPPPEFVSASLFPPKNISGFNPRLGITNNNIVSKMFVFDSTMIEKLRAKYGEGKSLENQKRPSRVEALSAFIWSRLVAASSQVDSRPNRVHAILHAVNLRTRIDPPLPNHSFGNLYRIAVTFPCLDTNIQSHEGLVKQMRDQISKVDKEYVRKLQEGNAHLNFITDLSEKFLKGESVTFSFTSLCWFPLYEYDFGWGKPTWVGSPPLTFNNLVVFTDTKLGDGIEAYINLDEEVMSIFESDEELLAFVSQKGLN
ncbi:hypothetical protein UlMin_040076 [Ulmus minor]